MAHFSTYIQAVKEINTGLKGVFSAFAPLLLKVEGGYQNNPNDNGNYNSRKELVGTKYGISARFYETVIGRPPTETDMKAITKTEALQLFKSYFWDRCMADEIQNQYVANTIVDHHVNTGTGIKLAQETLNKKFGYVLAEDNIMGPQTLTVLNSVDPVKFVEEYNKARETYYRKLGGVFLSGWIERIKSFAMQNKAAKISISGIILTTTVLIMLYKLNK